MVKPSFTLQSNDNKQPILKITGGDKYVNVFNEQNEQICFFA
jgi:hypothetical protein